MLLRRAAAMALRSPSSTPRRDLLPCESAPADYPSCTSQGGSSDGAEADAGRKTEEDVAHLLAKLEKDGVQIDSKLASIIDDGIANIRAEAMREKNSPKPKRKWVFVLHSIACMAFGAVVGMKCTQQAYFEALDREMKKCEQETKALVEELARRFGLA